ncbi:MAG TPA: hypothetical protein VLE89_06960, partial [Chlamydiales bacterium]|nr:hypothetical protein [Chlamydiales bacterium]
KAHQTVKELFDRATGLVKGTYGAREFPLPSQRKQQLLYALHNAKQKGWESLLGYVKDEEEDEVLNRLGYLMQIALLNGGIELLPRVIETVIPLNGDDEATKKEIERAAKHKSWGTLDSLFRSSGESQFYVVEIVDQKLEVKAIRGEDLIFERVVESGTIQEKFSEILGFLAGIKG